MNARARTIAVLGTMLLTTALPAAASAEVRTGSTTDGPGSGDGRDMRSVEATYDDVAGTFSVNVTLAAAAAEPSQALVVVELGVALTSGRCGVSDASPKAIRIVAGNRDGMGAPQWSEVDTQGGTSMGNPSAAYSGAVTSFGISSPAIAGRPYNCVDARLVQATAPPEGEDPETYDDLSSSVSLIPPATNPTPPPPSSTPPPPTATPDPGTVTPPTPDADAPPVRGSDKVKKGKASNTYIYGICSGKNVCRVDPKTRRLTTVFRARGKDTYDSVSASPSGRTLAFEYGGDIFRGGRDGKSRSKIGTGVLPAVSPDGRSVGWIQYITVPSCFPTFDFGLQCTYPLVPSLQRRALGEKDSTTVDTSVGSFAWYRSKTFVAATDPEEGEADFICELKDKSAGKDEGDCMRPVAADPARFFSSPSMSPDGRYLAVVSEPVPAKASNAVYKGRIALYNAATGKFIRNLTTSQRDEDPIFSPDGKTVAFNRGKDLLTVPTRGGAPTLVKRNLLLTGPSWAKRK